MRRLFVSKQFFSFLLTGGFAALVNFVSRIFYNQLVSYSTAIILAYITGMITAFILAKLFVFKSTTQKLHHSLFYFTLINVFAVLQTWGVSMALSLWFFPLVGVKLFVPEISHAIGIVIPVFTSFFGHKHLSFK